MLVRGDGLAQTMSTYLLDRIEHDTHLTVYPHTVLPAVHGDRQLEAVVLENRLTGEHTDVRTHHLSAMIGGERKQPGSTAPCKGIAPASSPQETTSLPHCCRTPTGRLWAEVRTCWRPACPAYSRSATFEPIRSSGSQPQ
jgi:hypothetical protein